MIALGIHQRHFVVAAGDLSTDDETCFHTVGFAMALLLGQAQVAKIISCLLHRCHPHEVPGGIILNIQFYTGDCSLGGCQVA